MMEEESAPIRIDLNAFKLYINIPARLNLSLHFASPSRKFYLSLVALVVHEMKKHGRITSIPLAPHRELLILLNETVGAGAGSSDKKQLFRRIYRKWKNALPDLEHAPLFRVLGHTKDFDDGPGKVYKFTDEEKDLWANLFEYKGSEEHVRLRFSVDKLGGTLDDVTINYGDGTETIRKDRWNQFIDDLRRTVEKSEPIKDELPAEEKEVQIPAVIRALLSKWQWAAPGILGIGIALGSLLFSYPVSFFDDSKKAGIQEMGDQEVALSEKPSIAVLPFVNMTGDPGQEYFSDGMTDDIVTDLSKISGLTVISRNSAFTFKGKELKLPVIAKELGVRYVLEGSIQRAGDEIRINAQLIDALSDHHIWADRFDGTNENIFDLQDRITGKIVSALSVKLSDPEKKIITNIGTHNYLAYEEYLKGMNHMRKFTPKDYADAIGHFKKAIEIDPNYSQAYANIAHIYLSALLGGKKFWDEMGLIFPTARLLARHYLELAMKNPNATAYQGLARMELYKRNFNRAIDYAEKAVAMTPNDADALHLLGAIMVWTGNPEEGIKYVKRSIMLDPLHKSTGVIGLAYFAMGNYEQAVKYYEKEIRDYPEKKSARGMLASTYALMGDDVKAKKNFKEFFT